MLICVPILALAVQGSRPAPKTIFVSMTGSDMAVGNQDHPFRTVQHACDLAGLGDSVTIGGGNYVESVRLTRSGNFFNRQITIQAAENAEVVLTSFNTGGQDHLIVRGLTIRNAPAEGISVAGSYRVRVENCRVEGALRSGIHIDKSHDVVVSHCDVANACKTGEESVSIKRSSVVTFEDSVVHDTGHEGIDVKEGSQEVIVRRNRVFNVERQGLYADAWDADTGHIRFENNSVYNCLVGLVACTETGGLLHDVTFFGNVVYDCRGPGMMLAKWGDQSKEHRIRGVAYQNNTVVNCGGPNTNGLWGGGLLMENDQAEDVLVENNVLAGNPYAQLRVSLNLAPKGIVCRGNLIDGPGENLVKGNLVQHALFVDAAKKDFRLAAGSPGVDAGVPIDGAPKKDASGNVRIQGKRIDVGAYESR